MTVRTRFAPSPTGNVHIGNIRVALYNWLFAQNQNGNFLLRLEDTDRERSTPEAVQTVLDAMMWLGLTWDEEPLYQSAQMQKHLDAAEKLLTEGHAYKEDKGGTGQGECIVFRMPDSDSTFVDLIKGPLTKKAKDMKDFVIVRSNGTPVFHLANVLDDIKMGITHVIRGDDHVENTFRHIALYHALGVEPPRFAHLPMIVNQQGKPYSKRDGDAYVGDFRAKEMLPDALVNYLALLGWSPGGDKELMSREEMTSLFSLDRVQSSPAQMDMQKLEWMNGEYMRRLPKDKLKAACIQALEEAGLWSGDTSDAYLENVLNILGDRIKFFSDIASQAGYFFTEEYVYEEKAVRKRLLKAGALDYLAEARTLFAESNSFTHENLEQAVREHAEKKEVGMGKYVHPIRVAVSGTQAGPGLFEMLEVLGKEVVLERIDRTLNRFKDQGVPADNA